MHIVIVGNVCIDKNTTENASYTAAGGPAVFMQKIFSQLSDVTTTIVTPYGDDFLKTLSTLPLFPTKPTSGTTLMYENIIKTGKRIQKAYNRDVATIIPIDQAFQKILSEADILFFTSLLPNLSPEYIKSLTRYCSSDCLKVLLPQGYYRDFTRDNRVIVRDFTEAKEIIPLVDVVIVSEEDTSDMMQTASSWTKQYNVISVITAGEKGAIAIQNEQKISLPTTPVPHAEVVDSVGSGDIFSACFAYAYKRTHSLQKAGEFANTIAGECLFFPADKIRIDKASMTI